MIIKQVQDLTQQEIDDPEVEMKVFVNATPKTITWRESLESGGLICEYTSGNGSYTVKTLLPQDIVHIKT